MTSKTSEIRLLKDSSGRVLLHVCNECSAALNSEELLEGRCPDYGHKLVWTEKEYNINLNL